MPPEMLRWVELFYTTHAIANYTSFMDSAPNSDGYNGWFSNTGDWVPVLVPVECVLPQKRASATPHRFRNMGGGRWRGGRRVGLRWVPAD